MDVLAGQLLYRLGRADEAYAKFLDAVNHYPEAPITFEGLLILVNDGIPVSDLQRGLTNYYASNYEPAVAAFERGLALTGTAALAPVEAGTALYYRALSLTALGRDDEAIVVLQELVNAYPTDPLWAKAYWQIAFIQPYPEAVETLVAFAKAAPSAPAAPEALYRAARLRERNGALAEAAALWTQIAENYPKAEQAADAALQAGLVFYRAGDEGSALTRFQQALALAPDAAQQARAWLWIGKTRQKQGDRASAQSAYQTAAALDPYGYYSLRAAELLRQETPFTPPNDYAVIFDKAAERAEAEQWLREHFPLAQGIGDLGALPPSVWREPRFTRGAALWQLGLLPEAHAEFDSLRRDLAGDPLALWPLALFWSQIGAYDLTIRATRQVIDLAGIAGSLNVPRYFLRLRYPTPFSEAVIAASADYDLHPFLMYAKMRLESFFWKYSYSSAAARGLNQIIPSTADDIARRLQLTNFTYADLYRPSVSIPMGAFYLDFVGQTTGHAPAAMLAGYYAGPGNAQLWLGLANGDPDLFVEVIRLPDARGYVQTAYEYFAVYREVWGR
jgi:soluble lytic murein transglycosylase